jgi:hexosaminidase
MPTFVHGFRPLQSLLLCLAFSSLVACRTATPTPPDADGNASRGPLSLIPQPASVVAREGESRIDADTTIAAQGDALTAARTFADLALKTHGVALRVVEGEPASGDIAFVLDQRVKPDAPEGYRLDVARSGIRVTASNPRGLHYGAVTLWQAIARRDDGSLRVPAMRIDDAPRFAWRGLMLDSARHFQGVDEIKRLLDAMALHKLNTFHWHLTDDQGWRIEIRRYPKLTEVGGCRVPAGDGGRDPRTGKPHRYCGYYTQQQIRDVVAYAAQRHITVVPEIDMPGHATAAIAAYPELGVTGKTLAVSNEWGVNTNLFNVEEPTLAFLENVLAEVVELFPGPYVHVGGDEAVKDQWEASPRVQARMRELGAKDEMAMQGHVIRRMERFLAARGKRLIGWDEILEGGLPPQATVMSWRGTEGGLAAATQGHDVVMSPVSHLYLDYLQTSSPNEPPGRPATIELLKVYEFDPVPEALAADKRHHILGVQANTWTEHMRTFARVQHAIFPRIAALAEVAWSPRETRDYDGFLRRLPAQLRRYDALDIAYARTPFEVRAEAQASASAPGRATVSLSNALGYEDIRYTIDGSAPQANSLRYEQPFDIALPAQVEAAAFFDGQPLLPAADTHRFSADALRERTDESLAMCTGALMLRLEDDGPLEGERAIFNADIFSPCWEWKQADLAGIAAIEVRAGRIPYYFQLAHDEKNRRFRPAKGRHGELEVRAGCEGETLASVPLPRDPGADGFATLRAPLPARDAPEDLCLYFTGDTRPTMWTLDRVRLVPR